jgi:hypothetical protein
MSKRVFTAATVVVTTASALTAVSTLAAMSGLTAAVPDTSAQNGASPWQRITSDLHLTKSSIPGGTILDVVDKSGDHISVQINLAAKTMIVSRNFDTRIVKDAQGLAAARVLLDSSPAVQGLQKLANERQRDNSPEGELIRVERMVVGLLSGEADAVKRHADRARSRSGSTQNGQTGSHGGESVWGALTIMKGLVARGPRTRLADAALDACWAQYNATVNQLVNTFIACRTSLAWYNIIDAWRCDFDYVLGAEAAWAVFWTCTGGTIFDGQSTPPPVQAAGCGA